MNTWCSDKKIAKQRNSEVASLCLALAGEPLAAETLEAYLDVFTSHYLNAKQSVPPDLEDAAHQRLRALTRSSC